MFVFGGRVFKPRAEETEDDALRSELIGNTPAELAAAASAAAAVEQLRLLLERLQARREALHLQVAELQNATGPSVEGLFSSTAPPAALLQQPTTGESHSQHSHTKLQQTQSRGGEVQVSRGGGGGNGKPRRSQEAPLKAPGSRKRTGNAAVATRTTTGAMRGGGGGDSSFKRHQQGQAPPSRSQRALSQLPVLTTSGENPFEVGLRPHDTSTTTTATTSAGAPGQTSGSASGGCGARGRGDGGDGRGSANDGSGANDGGGPGSHGRLMPVFLLPSVRPDAAFVRRIPREDTQEEEDARAAELEELAAMKEALGISDQELKELERETIVWTRRGKQQQQQGQGQGQQGTGEENRPRERSNSPLPRQEENPVTRAMREEASGKLLPRLDQKSLRSPSSRQQTTTFRHQLGEADDDGAAQPEIRSTPRSLMKSSKQASSSSCSLGGAGRSGGGGGGGVRSRSRYQSGGGGSSSEGNSEGTNKGRQLKHTAELRGDLSASLSSYESFADAVRKDITRITNTGGINVAASNPRAAGYMKSWGTSKFADIFTRVGLSLLGAGFERWRWAVRELKKAERREAYRKYQGATRLGHFYKNWLLKFVAVAWLKWQDLVSNQRRKEFEAKRHWAARKVQTRWRGHTSREAVNALRLVLERERRARAAVRVQKWLNGCRMRWAYKAMLQAKKEKEAATLLQARVRIVLAKKRKFVLWVVKQRTGACLTLQRCYRGRLAWFVAQAKLQELVENQAARAVQTLARSWVAKQQVQRLKLLKVQTRAAVTIQRRARGMLARSRCERLREERSQMREKEIAAALLCQKVYRGHQDRLKTAILLNSMRQRRKLEYNMAVRVQSGVRGLLGRKKASRVREGRDEGLFAEARLWQETPAEDASQGSFYLNVETGEAAWSPPVGGYLNLEGLLVLATGKVVEDPLNSLSEEEKRAKFLEKKCSECEERDSTKHCEQCGDKFCASCFENTHKQGARAKHVWQRLGPVECSECEGVPRPALRWCVVCDDPFCALHWDDMHKKGRRAMHPFCAIDEATGAVDVNAVDAAGTAQGRFAGVGPQERGGGDDGLGNTEVVEEDGSNAEGGGYEEAQEVQPFEQADGGLTGQQFEEAVDGEGNQYWFNSETGESTYEDPWVAGGGQTGVDQTGAGAAAADVGAGAAAAAEWEEHFDGEGNPYWHNAATGESTYDSPF